MGFVLGLLTVVAVFASIVLMLVILLQEPKGGGIAAALGGSGMEAIGPSVGSVNRFTAWVAGAWVAACFLHAILMPLGPQVAPKETTDKPAQGAQPGGAPGGGGEQK